MYKLYKIKNILGGGGGGGGGGGWGGAEEVFCILPEPNIPEVPEYEKNINTIDVQ